MRTLYQEGHYHSAFRLADAILVLAPEVPFAPELRRLRRVAEGRHLGASVLEVRFERGPEAGYPLAIIEGALVLENLTEVPLEIGRPGRRENAGQARARLTESYEDAGEWNHELTHPVVLDSGLVLAPRAVHRIPVRFDLAPPGRAPIVQRLEVRGTFRPSELRLPGQRLERTIPWLVHDEMLVRPDLAAALDRPFEQIQLGLLSEDAARLVAATLAHVEQEREAEAWRRRTTEVAKLLVDSLKADGEPHNLLLYRLLERVTGTRLEPSVASWRRWLESRQAAGHGKEARGE